MARKPCRVAPGGSRSAMDTQDAPTCVDPRPVLVSTLHMGRGGRLGCWKAKSVEPCVADRLARLAARAGNGDAARDELQSLAGDGGEVAFAGNAGRSHGRDRRSASVWRHGRTMDFNQLEDACACHGARNPWVSVAPGSIGWRGRNLRRLGLGDGCAAAALNALGVPCPDGCTILGRCSLLERGACAAGFELCPCRNDPQHLSVDRLPLPLRR